MRPNPLIEPIREALAAVWSSGGRQFVTFEAGGDEDSFVQYLDGQLNIAWPLDDDPATTLAALGAPLPTGAFHLAWAPHATAHVAVGALLLDQVAAFVLALLQAVHELEPGEGVTVRIDADR